MHRNNIEKESKLYEGGGGDIQCMHVHSSLAKESLVAAEVPYSALISSFLGGNNVNMRDNTLCVLHTPNNTTNNTYN